MNLTILLELASTNQALKVFSAFFCLYDVMSTASYLPLQIYGGSLIRPSRGTRRFEDL